MLINYLVLHIVLEAPLDSLTSFLHGLRCCLYLRLLLVWLCHGRTLRTFTEGLGQLVQKKIARLLACWLAGWLGALYAFAVDESVLSVAVEAVCSWDCSSFRVLVKCPVVGANALTAVLQQDDALLRCFMRSRCCHI